MDDQVLPPSKSADPGTVDDNLLGEDDMSSALSTIYQDPSYFQSPQTATDAFRFMYNQGNGQWDDDANDRFAEDVNNYQNAANVAPDLSYIENLNPPVDEALSEEENLTNIQTWREQVEQDLAKDGGVEWLLRREKARELLDYKARNAERELRGKEEGRIRDTISRLGNSALAVLPQTLGFDETAKAAEDYFDENPQYDDTKIARAAEVIGQAGGMLGISAITGGVAGGLSGSVALARAAFTGAGVITGSSLAYQDTYKRILEDTGSRQQAHDAALNVMLATGGVTALTEGLVTSRMLTPGALGLSEKYQRSLVAGSLASAGIGATGEFIEETAQSVATQALEEPYTGKPISYVEALEQGLYGAVAGGAIGGVVGGIQTRLSRGTPEAPAQEGQEEIPPELPPEGPTAPPAQPAPPGTPPEPPVQPLPGSAQKELASKLESFKEDPSQESLRLKGVKPSQVPQDVLDVLDLEVKESPLGSEVTRKKSITDQVETEATPAPEVATDEEENRLRGIPFKIRALQEKLSTLPNEQLLRKRYEGAKQALRQGQKAFSKIKNERGLVMQQAAVKELEAKVARYRKDLDQEVRYGKSTKERALIEDRVKNLQLEYDVAKDFLEPKALPTPKPVEAKTTKEGEATVEQKPIEPPVLLESKKSKVAFSVAIPEELRSAVNYWVAGFGLDNPNLVKQIHLLTSDDVKYFSELGQDGSEVPSDLRLGHEISKKLVKDPKFKQEGVVVLGKKQQQFLPDQVEALIHIKNPGSDVKSFAIASHEVGHIIFDTLWNSAPPEVQAAVKEEYKQARKRAAALPLTRDVVEVMSGAQGELGAYSESYLNTPYYKQTYGAKNYFTGYIQAQGRSKGFEEFFANRVSSYLLDPAKRPASAADSFYKKVADAFRRIINSLKNTFAEAPALETWLDEQFRTPETRETLIEISQSSEEVPGGREKTITKRVRTSKEFTKPVRQQVGVQEYTPKSREEGLSEARADIASKGVDAVANEVTSFSDRNPELGKINLKATEVVKEYNRLIAAETDPAKKAILEQKQADFAGKFADSAVLFGREVDAFNVFKLLTKNGARKFVRDSILKHLNDVGEPLPLELEDKINKVFDKHWERVQKAKGNVQTATAMQLLTGELSSFVPVTKASDVGWFYWYGNVLSGPNTQAINFGGNTVNLLLHSMGTALADPKNALAYFAGLGKGVRKGLVEGKAILRGRKVLKSEAGLDKLFNSKYSLIAPQVHWENQYLRKGANAVLRGLEKFPFRALNAVDAFFYRTAYEGQAALAANRAVKELAASEGVELTPERVARATSDMLHRSSAEFKAALAQAQTEWEGLNTTFTENDVYTRAFEIIEERIPDEIKTEAKNYALAATFMQRPEGTMGVIADTINAATKRVYGGKLLFPFVNVSANIISRSIDLSPFGLLRYARGGSIFTDSTYKSALEGRQRLAASVLGTTLASGIYAVASAYLDDKDPYIAIYGPGPKDKGERQSWLSKGALPYSIKIGNSYYKYSETPLALPFGFIGQVHDAERWNKGYDRKEGWQRYAFAMGLMGNVFLDQGVLRSLSTVTEVMSGDKNWQSIPANAAKGLIPGTGLLRDLSRFTDPTLTDFTDAKSVWLNGIPFVQSLARDSLNAFGEPIPKSPRFTSGASKDRVWNFLAKNDLSIPAMSTTVTIGTGSSSQEKRLYGAILKKREKDMGRFAYNVLTENEQYALQQRSGPAIKRRVAALVSDRKLTDAQLDKYQDLINKIVQEERRKAKLAILLGR